MIRLMVVSAALGVRLTVPQGAALTVFSIVGGLVPTVGSLGAIEGSLVTGLLLFGVPGGTATAITLVERAITYALSTALGAAALAAIGGWDTIRFARRKSLAAADADPLEDAGT
jgi:undecaprenyl-diphosphatase